MKMFKDFFFNSDNGKGFFEVWDNTEQEKLKALLGDYSDTDILLFDNYVLSKIGNCYISPLLYTIDKKYETLEGKQTYIIKTFSLLHYNELLKLKKTLEIDISVENGNTRTEKRNTDFETIDGSASYNAEDFENTEKRNHTEKNKITETNKRIDANSIMRNIDNLTEFYKKNIVSRITDYIKDLYTLGVM